MSSSDELDGRHQAVLDIILRDTEALDYFFSKSSDPLYFEPLRSKGHFQPDLIPEPIEAEDQKGFYSVPFWMPLTYLEALAKRNVLDKNEAIAKGILSVIHQASRYAEFNKTKRQNYHAWNAFVRILALTDPIYLTPEVIKYSAIWLDARFGSDIITSSLMKDLLPSLLKDSTANGREMTAVLFEILLGTELRETSAEEEAFGLKSERQVVLRADSYWLTDSLLRGDLADQLIDSIGERAYEIAVSSVLRVFRSEPRSMSWEFSVESHRYETIFRRDESDAISVEIRHTGPGAPASGSLVTGFELSPEAFQGDERPTGPGEDVGIFLALMRKSLADSKLSLIGSKLTDDLLSNIYYNLFDDYSEIWLKNLSALEIGREGARETLSSILVRLVERIVLSASQREPIKLTELGTSHLRYLLFRRLVVHIARLRWDVFGYLAISLVNNSSASLFFEREGLFAEWYQLLEDNWVQLSSTERNIFLSRIAKGPQYWFFVSKQNWNRKIAYWQQRWYSAIKGDPEVTKLYAACLEVTGIEVEIAHKQRSVQMGPGKPPMPPTEIASTPLPTLADRLNTFRNIDSFRGPNVDAFGESLRAAVMSHPAHFTKNMGPLVEVGYRYQYELLWGIRESWKKDPTLDWGEILGFIEALLGRSGFWEDEHVVEGDDWGASHLWVVGEIGRLIQDVTVDDSSAVPQDYDDQIGSILRLIVAKMTPDLAEITDTDPITHTLNSPWGKVLTGVIYQSLRLARRKKARGSVQGALWDAAMRDLFHKALTQKQIEAYSLTGRMLPQLRFLDAENVDPMVLSWAKTLDDDLWLVFMNSYLFGTGNVLEFYTLFSSHYERALRSSIERWDTGKLLAERIGLAYLMDVQGYGESGYLRDLVERWQAIEMDSLIRFFWSQFRKRSFHDELESEPLPAEPIASRLVSFWRLVLTKLSAQSEWAHAEKVIASNMAVLVMFLPRMDESIASWLISIAPYADYAHNSSWFVEYLDALKDRGEPAIAASILAEVYSAMLATFTPIYQEKYIVSSVRFMFQNGDERTKRLAADICNHYARHKQYFLAHLYADYKNS